MDSKHSVPFCSRFPIFLRANGTSGLLLNFQFKTLFSDFENWSGMLWNMYFVAYELFKMRYYHLQEEYLASLRK